MAAFYIIDTSGDYDKAETKQQFNFGLTIQLFLLSICSLSAPHLGLM